MKRIFALILCIIMVLPILVGCASETKKTTETPAVTPSVSPDGTPSISLSGTPSASTTPSGAGTPTPTPTPSDSVTPSPEPDPLPSNATLVGTKHLPIVDSQGNIGCCSAEAITYAQFTVAVSQYVNSLDPNSDWDPSSGADEYTFSPKFTYNFSGSGTEYNYEVLKTIGCLPMSYSSHAKTQGSEDFRGGAILGEDQSRSWDIEAGKMIEALNFRLTGYEEDEFTATNDGKLTTNETGLKLLEKVKDAVSRGNAVVICGWSNYWQMTQIDQNGLGTLGKKGDQIIWNGYKSTNSQSDGNHAVTIVGYDDEITVTKGGVTQKGAFQVMNSWGQYANNGFVWMTYDACNVVSEHPLYQNEYFYKPVQALSFSGSLRAVTPYSSIDVDLETIFKPDASIEISGTEYPTYRLSHKNGKHLTFRGGNLSSSNAADKNSVFAVIPYADLVKNPKEGYENSVVLYAVKAKKYISLSNGTISLTDDLETRPFNVCLTIDDSNKNEDGSFVGMVNTVYQSSESYYERTGTIYRFSFTYWDKHITVGRPKLAVEIELSAISRDNLYIALNRTDANGVKDTFLPASTFWRIDHGVLPDLEVEGDPLSFSGKRNPTEEETGVFAFYFDALAGIGDFECTDFLWGVDIQGSGITVKGLRLLDEERNVLAEIKTDSTTAALVKGETSSFVFDLGGELKNYFGTGNYRLMNVGTGKILSANGAGGMLFGWEGSGSQKDEPERAHFTIEYNQETDSFRFWNNTGKYLFDISKTDVQNGTVVKLNAPNNKRDTQDWQVTFTEEGYMRITLKNHPEYAFGAIDDKTFGLSSTDTSENFLWMLKAITEETPSTTIEEKDGKLALSVAPFEKYTEGTVSVKIVKNGEIVTTLEGTPAENGALTVETTLDAGCYLFVVMYNDQEVGTQLIYNVK